MAKREFCLLAHKYDPKKHKVDGLNAWFCSEKLDGVRCIYDGGITRGMLAKDVPWANVAKDDRYLKPIYATGLWTRLGKTIQMPSWFLNMLPEKVCLDSELWLGRKRFQETLSIVKDLEPGSGWKKIKMMVFDLPAYWELFGNGVINVPMYKKDFSGVYEWVMNILGRDFHDQMRGRHFEYRYNKSIALIEENENLQVVDQRRLDIGFQLQDALEKVVASGGEGLILRNPRSLWTPNRSHDLLKVKPSDDSEAIVKGYTFGRKTELGSKLLGKMGALIVEWHGKQFELSGFTDVEREMTSICNEDIMTLGEKYEGQIVNSFYAINKNFMPGSKVTFTYNGLTDKGLPKEARYLRKYENDLT